MSTPTNLCLCNPTNREWIIWGVGPSTSVRHVHLPRPQARKWGPDVNDESSPHSSAGPGVERGTVPLSSMSSPSTLLRPFSGTLCPWDFTRGPGGKRIDTFPVSHKHKDSGSSLTPEPEITERTLPLPVRSHSPPGTPPTGLFVTGRTSETPTTDFSNGTSDSNPLRGVPGVQVPIVTGTTVSSPLRNEKGVTWKFLETGRESPWDRPRPEEPRFNLCEHFLPGDGESSMDVVTSRGSS